MLKIERKSLVEALERVSATVGDVKIPAIKCVLMRKMGDKLALITTDLTAFSMSFVKCEGDIEGFCVEHSSLLSASKAMIGENVELETANNAEGDEALQVKVKVNSTEIKLPALALSEFPEFPSFRKEGVTEFELEASELQKSIKHVAFAASKEDIRPILKAVNLSINNNFVTFTAIDGAQMAMITVEAKNLSAGDFLVANVPAELFNKIVQKNGKDNVKLKVSKDYLFVEYEVNKYVIRLLEGQFVDVASIVKSSCNKDEKKATIKVNKEEMVNACNLINVFGEKLGTLGIKDKELKISAVGKGQLDKELKIEGEVLEESQVSVNSQALSKGLSVIEDENIIMHFYGKEKPIIINPASGYNFLFLQMPVRTKK